MRTTTYTFLRDGAVVAELSLQLRRDGSVERSLWKTGPEARQFLSWELPADAAAALLEKWHVAIMKQTAKVAGLSFTLREEEDSPLHDEADFQPHGSGRARGVGVRDYLRILDALREISVHVGDGMTVSGVPKAAQPVILRRLAEAKELSQDDPVLLAALELLWLHVTPTFQQDFYVTNSIDEFGLAAVRDSYEKLAEEVKRCMELVMAALEPRSSCVGCRLRPVRALDEFTWSQVASAELAERNGSFLDRAAPSPAIQL